MEIEQAFNKDVDGVADNLFSAVKNSVSEIKAMQQRKAAENVQMVIQALKKIESDLQDKFDGVTTVIEKRVASIKDGRDGLDGRNGRDGKDGRPGRDGAPGARGPAGVPGTNGRDGEDGVSVTDARIDFDGSLIISLSSGREINVGEVVAPDLAEKIKVITNGGGTSQSVLDTLASLQSQITALTNLGAVNYVGTWNASTNTPTIVNGTGDKGDYYVVSVAGSTNIDGQTLWGVGDWIIFNGVVWQKVDGGSTGDFTNLSASGTVTFSGGTATGVAYLNASKVLTTGSSVTFDGTTFSVSGNLSSTAWLASGNSSAPAADAAVYRPANDTLGFSTASAERMRLNATGLGIGTNNPAYKLDVSGTAAISGAVTLSGGTANGVAYLNGSKVLTTGSALRFDGDTFFAPAIFVSNSTNLWNLALIRDTSTTYGVNNFYVKFDNSTSNSVGGIYHPEVTSLGISAETALIFGIGTSSGATEKMRLTSTTLSLVDNPTLSAGTANGVAYLNGSKVLTTGSALTFDGTNLGVGGSSPSNAGYTNLYLNNTTGSQIFMSVNGANSRVLYSNASALNYYISDASPHVWHINAAEQMRLTSTGLGIGTSSPTQPLAIRNANAAYLDVAGGSRTLGTNSFTFGQASDGVVAFFQRENAAMYWATNSTERMRLDASGNLGIGTSSPLAKLDVRGNAYFAGNGTSRQSAAFVNTGGNFEIGAEASTGGAVFSGSSAYAGVIGTQNSTSLQLGTNGAVRATIDSSGNLGLGVTPSGWGGEPAFELRQAAALFGFSATTNLLQNAYYNGSSWIYKNTAGAMLYQVGRDAHRWFTAASGTAGNAISFTQALTLTAAANLLLGGTSDPGGEKALYIANTSSVPGTPSGGGVLYVEGGALKYKGSSGTVTTIANA